MIAAVFSIIVGATLGEDKSVDWIEGVAILFAVFLVSFVTALNDFQKEKQFKALQAKQVRSRIEEPAGLASVGIVQRG
jgi:1,4-dihydroxy-2-naphthoate octaprenyltransferase